MIRTRSFVAFVVVVAAATVAWGQTDRWYPSRWGAADQRGAANRITPAKVLEAKNAIQKGTIYQLGHVYEAGMPMFGTRHFSIRIPAGLLDARQEPGGLSRRGHQRRAGSDRHAVRRPRSPRHRRSLLQRQPPLRVRAGRGADEARHRERRGDRDARRAHRRREVQGRRAAARAATRSPSPISRARCRSRTSRSDPATWC